MDSNSETLELAIRPDTGKLITIIWKTKAIYKYLLLYKYSGVNLKLKSVFIAIIVNTFIFPAAIVYNNF